jgi:hypothetical protein
MARKLPWLSGTNSKASNINPRNDTRSALQHRNLRTSDDDSNRDQAVDVNDTPPRARFKARTGASNTNSVNRSSIAD